MEGKISTNYIITQKDFFEDVSSNLDIYNDLGFGSNLLEIRKNLLKYLHSVSIEVSSRIKKNKLCRAGLYINFDNFSGVIKSGNYYYFIINLLKSKYNIEFIQENNILYCR